jgi:hypothetical protein
LVKRIKEELLKETNQKANLILKETNPLNLLEEEDLIHLKRSVIKT